MEALYVSNGHRIPHTPGAAIAAGEIVVIGDAVLVATEAIAQDVEGSLADEGVFDVDKPTTGVTFSNGDDVFFKASTNQASATPGDGVRMGRAIKAAIEADSTVRVKLAGSTAGNQAATVAALTDNSGGAAADGTIGAVTAPTALTDNGGGTADGTVDSEAAPVTLTDSTGLSGSHDDTLAATTTQADISGGEDPTEAEFNTLLAEVRVIAQNESDLGQKVIELVTLAGTARNNLKELTTRQAENRTAIVALTDAVKELSTKTNSILTALKNAGLMA